MKNFNIKEKLKTKRGKTTTAVTGLLLLTLVGGVAAKYVTENRSKAEMLSSDFHISSNYLEESSEDAKYTVTDWGDHGIEILLFNYEKTNVASISGTDIQYTVEVPTDWEVKVKNSTGNEVTPTNNNYNLPVTEGATTTQTLNVKYTGDGEPTTSVTIKVTTNAPYKKELSATFTLAGKAASEYEVEDKGDYVVLTIYSNDYEGNDVKITWTDNYSPDNTNATMANWQDASGNNSNVGYMVDLEENTTYELIFVENEECNWNLTRTSGKTIQIGQ